MTNEKPTEGNHAFRRQDRNRKKKNETWEGKSLAIPRRGLHSNCLKVQMLLEIILNSLKDVSTGMLAAATASMLA